tara:strand:- start:1174 stop:1512 length:339 start_codon:yes stop_codon:yes gene_type:complete
MTKDNSAAAIDYPDMTNLLSNIVKDLDDHVNAEMASDLRKEIADMEAEIKTIQGWIADRRATAIKLDFAEMVVTGKPSQLAPTMKMYIELHGQEAFDAVKRLGKAPEKFTWK